MHPANENSEITFFEAIKLDFYIKQTTSIYYYGIFGKTDPFPALPGLVLRRIS